MFNKQKSAIFFSENCEEGDKVVVHNSLQNFENTVEALGAIFCEVY